VPPERPGALPFSPGLLKKTIRKSRGKRMAEHSSPTLSSQVDLDSFLEDRRHFWVGFTHFAFWVAAAVALLLILMAIFLL